MYNPQTIVPSLVYRDDIEYCIQLYSQTLSDAASIGRMQRGSSIVLLDERSRSMDMNEQLIDSSMTRFHLPRGTTSSLS